MKLTAQLQTDIACPITREPMEHPVLAADGFTYERSAIEKWFQKESGSPMLGSELESHALLENRTVDFFLAAWRGVKTRFAKRKPASKTPKTPVPEQLELLPSVKEKLDVALSHYYMATKDLKECCDMMNEVYLLAPKNFDVIYNYANILRFAMKFEEALKLIQELRRLRPNSLIPKYMKVRVLSEMGKRDHAVAYLDNTATYNRLKDQTLLETRFMSYAHLSTDSKGAAEALIGGYLAVVPNDPRAISHQIYIYLLDENYKKVVKGSKIYLKSNKNDVSIMFHLAKAYTKLEKKEKAKKVYKDIATLSNDHTVKAKALYELAVLRDCNTEMEAMVKDLEESYKLDPQEEADGYLAALYADRKMFDKAEEWLKSCESRTSVEEDSVYLGIRAQIQEHKKEFEKAIESYIRLAEIDPANSTYYSQKVEDVLIHKANPDAPEEEADDDSPEGNTGDS